MSLQCVIFPPHSFSSSVMLKLRCIISAPVRHFISFTHTRTHTHTADTPVLPSQHLLSVEDTGCRVIAVIVAACVFVPLSSCPAEVLVLLLVGQWSVHSRLPDNHTSSLHTACANAFISNPADASICPDFSVSLRSNVPSLIKSLLYNLFFFPLHSRRMF